MSLHDIHHATIAQTDIYFAAVWLALCIGIVFGFVLAGGFNDKGADQEDQTTADDPYSIIPPEDGVITVTNLGTAFMSVKTLDEILKNGSEIDTPLKTETGKQLVDRLLEGMDGRQSQS